MENEFSEEFTRLCESGKGRSPYRLIDYEILPEPIKTSLKSLEVFEHTYRTLQ